MKKNIYPIVACGLMAVLLTGCVTKGAANKRASQAYIAGQRDALARQNKTDSVWVVGNVWNPIIPWTEDLTLARAIIAADYRGAHDPREVILLREGSTPFHISTDKLLKGFDIPLHVGDRVELRQ